MDDVTKTEKMLRRKEGRVGYVIYNNPEKHNAVSLDMWEGAVAILEDFKNDKEIGVVVVTGAGGQARSGLRLRRAEAAGRQRRAVLRHGDFLHGAAIHRSRVGHHGSGEPG